MDRDGKGVAALVDEIESRATPNQRLLVPENTPKNLMEASIGIGMPMPTRICTRESAMAFRALSLPMFGNASFYGPDSLEVGEARNEIVRSAMRDGVEYLFFMDYDVSPPPYAIQKLLTLKTDIAAGVYHAKQIPSYPLILVRGHHWAFEDYEYGDLISADAVGMGCTLIKMSVFEKIEEPWFKTVPPVSKDGLHVLPTLTEDVYFCDKAKAAGFEIIVDTSVQAGHTDWRNGVTYHLIEQGSRDSRKPIPGWTYRHNGVYITECVGDAKARKRARVSPIEFKDENPPLDLGCADSPSPGHLGVDPFISEGLPGIRREDMRNLKWYRDEFGMAPSIYSNHSMEHIPYRDVPAMFRDWFLTIRPGGNLTVAVPDGEKYLRSYVQYIEDGKDDSFEMTFIHNGLFGDETRDGQIHQSIYTESSLRALAETTGFVDVTVEKLSVDAIEGVKPEVGHLILRAKKPPARPSKKKGKK